MVANARALVDTTAAYAMRWLRRWAYLRRLLLKVPPQEVDGEWKRNQLVFQLGDLVPFVIKPQKLDRTTERLQPGHHLLSFVDRHARVVGAVDHQQRGGDPLDVVDRRDLFQKLAIVLQTAVL